MSTVTKAYVCDPQFYLSATGANAAGESPGDGAAYACGRYGEFGHNYITCRDCLSGFMRHMDAKEAA